MENKGKFHPIVFFLISLMKGYSKRDLKKIGIQIHKPNILDGESYIFIRCFLRDESDNEIGEQIFKFCLETGLIKELRDKEFKCTYSVDSISGPRLDLLERLIEKYLKDFPDQVESVRE